jgi:alkylation response protein AidB-like acyl-CoA dehydrogenase
MMDFHLTADELELKQLARDFAQKRLHPNGEKFDEHQSIPLEIIKEAGELGYFGFTIPEQYGGLGLSKVPFMGVLEELAGGSASFAMMLASHASLCCETISRFASEEIKQKYLPSLASGKSIAAYCLSEPNAGTDIYSIEANAKLSGDQFTLNGTKAHVTNAGIASVFIVFAKTDNDNFSCFLVDNNSPGISVGQPENKCGVKASDTRSVRFENVKVAPTHLIGDEGRGLDIAKEILVNGRISMAFQAVGIAQSALNEATKYSQIRKQFNQTISKFQAIQFKLSEMATRIDAGRLLAYRAAQLRDENKPCRTEASMAKLFCAETANFVCDQAVQIHGGYGYIKEYAVERYFRDARATEIADGTAEAQRMVIASSLLKEQKLA